MWYLRFHVLRLRPAQARDALPSHGAVLPRTLPVVFRNVNNRQTRAPVTAHTRGTALTSGAGTHAPGHRSDGSVALMAHMLRVLNSGRCAMIHA